MQKMWQSQNKLPVFVNQLESLSSSSSKMPPDVLWLLLLTDIEGLKQTKQFDIPKYLCIIKNQL